jgi:flagellar assembly protein FliH
MTSSSSAFDFAQLEPPPAPQPAPAALPVDPGADPAVLLAAAQADAERVRADAQAAGFEEGRLAGLEAARAELEPAVHALAEAVAGVHELRERAAEDMERTSVELGLQIAEKALAAAVEVQPERVVDVVRGALRCMIDRERVTVLVNPADLDLVRGAVDELVLSLGGIEHIEVQEERRVGRGGAVVRSAAGEIDGRLETKLERAREVLEAELAS